MRVELRPTIAEDLAYVIAVPLPHRIRAVTALADGKVIGVGGIAHRPDGTVVAFAAMLDEFRKYPAAVPPRRPDGHEDDPRQRPADDRGRGAAR